ncbi:carbohydrate-binding protein [Streptomyces sp. NPDC006704]|uniref:carbohydrate-binding protein n=1 Tax=Streptomyces sp. NPDC006704 TaxID=3364760 RepID=UPI00369D33ED
MAQYGLDFYALSRYGADVRVEYSVEPVTAVPTDSCTIQLTWSPSKEDNWVRLRLVRSPHGVPGDADDGDVLMESDHQGLVATYLDTNLVPGRYYYYAVYVSAPFLAWSSASTYQPGDCVTYNGVSYICQVTHNGVIPGGAASAWSVTTTATTWVRAGSAASMSVADHRYAERMYHLLPPAYRTAAEEITGLEEGISNQTLAKYLSLQGFEFDVMKTELDNMARLRDQQRSTITQTERAADTLGLERPLSNRAVLRRRRVDNSTLTNRRKGSEDGLRQLIRDMTGWDAEFNRTPNLLIDQDQSGIWHPVYQDWKAGIRYAAGEYVLYGGQIYRAKSAAKVISAPSLLPATAIQSQGQVMAQTDKIGSRVFAKDFRDGDSFTLTFTLDTTATYDVAALYTTSYDYSIMTTALDGQPINTFDGYFRTVASATVNLGRLSLTAGQHTLTYTSRGKNAASGGWQMGVNTVTFTPIDSRSAPVAPAGQPDSNLFWEPVTSTPRDWSLQPNTVTLDPSTWWLRKDGAAARMPPGTLGIQSGMTPVSGSQYAGTSLTFTTPTAGESYTLSSISPAQTRAWDPTVTYRVGNLVTYTNRTWEATATAGSGQVPGKSKDVWRPSLVTAGQVTPDASLVTSYGVPIPRVYTWTPDRTYARHDVVAYGRYRFEAVTPSQGIRPPATPQDSAVWSFAGGDVEMLTASAHARLSNGTKIPNLACEIAWYDDSAALMANIDSSGRSSAGVLYDRFDVNRDDLKATSVGATDTETWTTTGGRWPVTGGAAHAEGSAAPGGTYLTTLLTRPSAISSDTTGSKPFTLSATFLSRPADPLAMQGIAFFITDPASLKVFTLAARDGLYRISLSGGLYQAVRMGAAWTEFQDGERLTVSYNGARTISVKKSTGSRYGVTEVLRFTNSSDTDMVGTYVGLAEIKR